VFPTAVVSANRVDFDEKWLNITFGLLNVIVLPYVNRLQINQHNKNINLEHSISLRVTCNLF
jgi:hypothetical protein